LTEVYDFEPSNDIYNNATQYNSFNVDGLNSQFGETNQNGFNYLGDITWSRVGFYLNDLLDDNRDYPAIGFAVGSTTFTTSAVTTGWGDCWVYVVH
jgi:hypothetical protein